MPSSQADLELAETYRQTQVALRNRFLKDSLALWPLLDKARIGKTSPNWLKYQILLIKRWRALSASAAGAYYLKASGHQAIPGLQVPEQTIIRNLLHAGPGEIDRALKRGLSEPQADTAARISASQSGARLVLGGGRDTIDATVKEDPEALGWMRITDGNPCSFCAMLASRGAVYETFESAGFDKDPRDVAEGDEPPISKWHDGCGCTVVPVFKRPAVLSETSSKFEKLWITSTRGLSGNDARIAFRRAVEGR